MWFLFKLGSETSFLQDRAFLFLFFGGDLFKIGNY